MRGRTKRNVRDEIARIADASTTTDGLLRDVAAGIQQAIPFDGWCGAILDPATGLKIGGVHESGIAGEAFRRVLEIEYGEQDVNCFTDMIRTSTPAATLHESTGGRPERSRRFRDVIEPAGYGHELRLVMVDRGRPWGGYVLLRSRGSFGFTDSERRFVAALSSRLARNLRRTVAAQSPISQTSADDHPGLLLLDPNGNVDTMTTGFLESIDRLVDVGSVSQSRLPSTLHALIARTSAMPVGSPVRVQLPTTSGHWLTVHAWRLTGREHRIAVAVAPSQPGELTSHILHGYGLSDREIQVTQLALLGHSTAHIAKALFLSPYTVQDHLKAVFDKTGVRSRRQLAAHLFFNQNLPIPHGAGP